MPSDRFSYSRLQLFNQCHARYRFTYLDSRPAGGESIESFLGGRLHKALEWLYCERRTGRNILFDDLLRQYRSLWKKAWHGSVHIAQPGWQTKDYYELGQRCLAGFYRRYAPFYEPVDSAERILTFELDNQKPPAAETAKPKSQGSYLMTAILDRLDRHGPGWWSIHDYKSGRKMLTTTQAQKNLQMKIYYLALIRTMNHTERVDVVWHFIRHGREVALEDVKWNPKRITTMLRKRIDKVRQAEEQPEILQPQESILCNWCYFWDVCPAKVGQIHPARLAV
ncbi:RecB family exonuclease [Candidatus Neomarinimicrobiota bacterium]